MAHVLGCSLRIDILLGSNFYSNKLISTMRDVIF